MKISIIGKGRVGAALKLGLERVGHEVRTVGRDAREVRNAAEFADLVILAVPFAEIDTALSHLGSGLDGKIVIDATNALTPEYSLAVGFNTSGAELLQAKIPAANVIKAFNTTFANTMANGEANGQQLSGLVAGDDAAAKRTVLDLVAAIGFDPVDVSPLEVARLLEPFALLTIKLGLVQGHGPDIGFRLVH